jgi:hypothetical protein
VPHKVSSNKYQDLLPSFVKFYFKKEKENVVNVQSTLFRDRFILFVHEWFKSTIFWEGECHIDFKEFLLGNAETTGARSKIIVVER